MLVKIHRAPLWNINSPGLFAHRHVANNGGRRCHETHFVHPGSANAFHGNKSCARNKLFRVLCDLHLFAYAVQRGAGGLKNRRKRKNKKHTENRVRLGWIQFNNSNILTPQVIAYL